MENQPCSYCQNSDFQPLCREIYDIIFEPVKDVFSFFVIHLRNVHGEKLT